MAPGKRSTARFHREAKAMGVIDTDPMVRALDAERDSVSKAPYLATDLLAGGDIEQLFDKGRTGGQR
ncbi:hypothetical protein WMF30_35275 [Sorangium sp. So ce134]